MSESNAANTHSVGEIQPILSIDIILFVVCCIGTTLNLLLLYLTSLRKGPKPIDVVLILIISLFDSLFCLSLIVSLIFRWRLGSEVLIPTSLWCKLNSFILNSSLLSTLVGTVLLSIVRYLALVRNWQISNKLWIAISLCFVVLVWVTFTYRSLSNDLVVYPSGFYCIPMIFGEDWETNLFGIMVQIIIYPAPVIILVCYILIIIHFHRKFSRKFNPFVRRGTFHLVLTAIAYGLCVFPDYIHILLSQLINLPRTNLSDGIVITLSFSVTIINALFALFMHDEINDDFRSLLRCSDSLQSSFQIS